MLIVMLIQFVEFLVFLGFVLQLVFGYFLVCFDWQQCWYMVSDVVLCICEGFYQVCEQMMIVVNVQNMLVKQGLLQKFFGMLDFEVYVVGGGGFLLVEEGELEDLYCGVFCGFDNVEEICDLICGVLVWYCDVGLGDFGDVVCVVFLCCFLVVIVVV